MAKGFDTHQERLHQLSLLGKELTRRSRAKCELCAQSGIPLSLYEVPPAPKEPALDQLLHICQACLVQLEKPKTIEPNRWRILSETIWSQVPAAQVMAIRLLKRLSRTESWAQEILESAYVDDELNDWAEKEIIN